MTARYRVVNTRTNVNGPIAKDLTRAEADRKVQEIDKAGDYERYPLGAHVERQP